MKQRIQGIVIGFIIASLLSGAAVWAGSVLQAIYVDSDPISIFIDGQERNPPADMQPFIYNGRTYVALRYVGEAFGKKVDWEDATRKVVISDPRPALTEYSESFTDPSSPIDAGKYWLKTEGTSWRFDGANGLLINSTGNLTLHDVLPESFGNYTIEFDAAGVEANVRGLYGGLLASFCLGTDDGNLGDTFTMRRGHLSGTYPSSLHYTHYAQDASSDNNVINTIQEMPGFRENEFVHIKIQIQSRYANIYIDGEHIASVEVSMGKPAFAFNNYRGVFDSDDGYYIKNFNLNID